MILNSKTNHFRKFFRFCNNRNKIGQLFVVNIGLAKWSLLKLTEPQNKYLERTEVKLL